MYVFMFLKLPVPRIRRQILENKKISKVTVKAIHLGHKIMGQEVVGQAELNPSWWDFISSAPQRLVPWFRAPYCRNVKYSEIKSYDQEVVRLGAELLKSHQLGFNSACPTTSCPMISCPRCIKMLNFVSLHHFVLDYDGFYIFLWD